MVSPNVPVAVTARRWPEFDSHAMAILLPTVDAKPVAVTSANDAKAVALQIQVVTTTFEVPAINPTFSLPALADDSICNIGRSVSLFELSRYCYCSHVSVYY